MPTGYTAVLYEGEQSFQDFLLRCARAFGYVFDQRDEGLSVAPRHREPDDSLPIRLEKDRQELAEIEAWTDEKAATEANADYQRRLSEWLTSSNRKDARKARYERILEQARAWQPPTPEHENLKQYMIDQLVESIEYDCTGSWYDSPPVAYTGKEYRQARLSMTRRSIEYLIEDIRRDLENVAKANAWIDALYASLKGGVVSDEYTVDDVPPPELIEIQMADEEGLALDDDIAEEQTLWNYYEDDDE